MFRAPDPWDIPVKREAPHCGYHDGLLAKYARLPKALGKGGFGEVSIVVNNSTGVQYACKSISKLLDIPNVSAAREKQHIENIRREVSVLRKLRGTLNVVYLEDVFEDATHVHIVMELCRGGELLAKITQRHYSERTVASYMRAVLRTLAQCHHHRILHRDIKPGNFMLLTDAEDAPVKAIDFGLAVFFDPKQLPMHNLGLEGTPHYMAPECLSSEVYPASDVWAAGVMVYQLISGRFPFDDWKNLKNPALSALWKSILTEEPKFSGSAWEDVTDGAKDFVKQLLNKDPKTRLTAQQALAHPWIQGKSKQRVEGKPLASTIVQRLQRFSINNAFKRTVLDMIANELLEQHFKQQQLTQQLMQQQLQQQYLHQQHQQTQRLAQVGTTGPTGHLSRSLGATQSPLAALVSASEEQHDSNGITATGGVGTSPGAGLARTKQSPFLDATVAGMSQSHGNLLALNKVVADVSHPQMRSMAACSFLRSLKDKAATVHAGTSAAMALQHLGAGQSVDRGQTGLNSNWAQQLGAGQSVGRGQTRWESAHGLRTSLDGPRTSFDSSRPQIIPPATTAATATTSAGAAASPPTGARPVGAVDSDLAGAKKLQQSPDGGLGDAPSGGSGELVLLAQLPPPAGLYDEVQTLVEGATGGAQVVGRAEGAGSPGGAGVGLGTSPMAPQKRVAAPIPRPPSHNSLIQHHHNSPGRTHTSSPTTTSRLASDASHHKIEPAGAQPTQSTRPGSLPSGLGPRPARVSGEGSVNGHALQHYAFLLAAGERSLHGLSRQASMRNLHAFGSGHQWPSFTSSMQHGSTPKFPEEAAGAFASQPGKSQHASGTDLVGHPTGKSSNASGGDLAGRVMTSEGGVVEGLEVQGPPRSAGTTLSGETASMAQAAASILPYQPMDFQPHFPHTVHGMSNVKRLLNTVQKQRKEHRKLQRLMLDTSGHAMSLYEQLQQEEQQAEFGDPRPGHANLLPLGRVSVVREEKEGTESIKVASDTEGVGDAGAGAGGHKKTGLLHKVGRALLQPVKAFIRHSTSSDLGGSESNHTHTTNNSQHAAPVSIPTTDAGVSVGVAAPKSNSGGTHSGDGDVGGVAIPRGVTSEASRSMSGAFGSLMPSNDTSTVTSPEVTVAVDTPVNLPTPQPILAPITTTTTTGAGTGAAPGTKRTPSALTQAIANASAPPRPPGPTPVLPALLTSEPQLARKSLTGMAARVDEVEDAAVTPVAVDEEMEVGGRGRGAYAALLSASAHTSGTSTPLRGRVSTTPQPSALAQAAAGKLGAVGASGPTAVPAHVLTSGAGEDTPLTVAGGSPVDMPSIHTVKAHRRPESQLGKDEPAVSTGGDVAEQQQQQGVPAAAAEAQPVVDDSHNIAAQLARIEAQHSHRATDRDDVEDAAAMAVHVGGTVSRGMLYNALGNLLGGPAQLAEFQSVLAKLKYDEHNELSFEQISEGLQHLGYHLEPSEVEALLSELALGGQHISQGAFLASQVDWRQFQANHREEWLALLRKAFDGLARATDGRIGEEEIMALLREKLPEEEVNLAVQETLLDAAVLGAEGLDFDDFARLLRADSESDFSMGSGYGGATTMHAMGTSPGTSPSLLAAHMEAGGGGLHRSNSMDLYDSRFDGSLHGHNPSVRRGDAPGVMSVAGTPPPAMSVLPPSWVAGALEHGSVHGPMHAYGYAPGLATVPDDGEGDG